MKKILIYTFLWLVAFQAAALETVYANPIAQLQHKTGQQASVAADSTASQAATEEKSAISSLLQLTALAGPFRWFILLTLAIGIAFAVWEAAKLLDDYLKSRRAMATPFKTMAAGDVNRVFAGIQTTFLAQIGSKLLEVFEKTNSTQSFAEEISQAIRLRQQQFNSFSTTINFLSDTAGALGLLGTVWGMFITFFSETWDTTTILRGMGIALVTTLLGLAVSIILNFCSTNIFRFFNSSILRISGKADELRMALLAVNSPGPLAKGRVDHSEKEQDERIKLAPVSKDRLFGIVGQPLDEPICVQIKNSKNKPVPGKKISFAVAAGEATFENNQKALDLLTDEKGRAAARFTPGKSPGEYVVQCSKNGYGEAGMVEFKIQAQPGPPAKLQRLSREYQSAKTNNKAASPLQVAVMDGFDNPVPNCPIVFKASGGRFSPANKQEIETATDKKGRVSVDFISGEKPGIYKVQAFAKDASAVATEFTLMAEE
ncbi:MAG: Ig-like domain-containing protein [bacterium]